MEDNLCMANYGGQLWKLNYGRQIFTANYGGQLWRTIYGWKIMEDNYGGQNKEVKLWQTNYGS